MIDSANKDEYRDEIDLQELFSVILDEKKFIILMVLFSVVISVMTSLALPKIWISSAVLEPIEVTGHQSSTNQSSSRGISSNLAALTGMGMSGSSQEAIVTVEKIKSRDFLNHLLKFDGVAENLIAIKKFDSNKRISIFKSSLINNKTGEWLNGEPSSWDAYKAYRGMLGAEISMKSGLVEIDIEHKSPVFAKYFLDLIIQEINALSRDQDYQESVSSLDYLQDLLEKTIDQDMSMMLTSMIQSQIKTQMLSKIKEYYVLEPIDKPYLPIERSSPQRTRIVVLSTLLGLILSLVFVVFRYYGFKNKLIDRRV